MTTNYNKHLDIDQAIKLAEIESKIGKTPLVELKGLSENPKVKIFAKQEWKQLGGSIKARAAFYIIKDALEKNTLQGKTLIDATSGNTGIAYAIICKEMGIPVTLAMPETASIERQSILQKLGVKLMLTPGNLKADGAINAVKNLVKQHPEKYFHANQYDNAANWLSHYYTTANEIWLQTNKNITHFVVGHGTSGTIMGNGKRLKELNSNIQVVSIKPDNPEHKISGWKHMESCIVPAIYNPNIADKSIIINTKEAYNFIYEMAKTKGIFIGPSGAGNIAGAVKLANTINEGIIVTTLADDRTKYSQVYKELNIKTI